MDVNIPSNSFAKIALALALLAIILGAAGMAVGLLFLSSGDQRDVIAGAAGFVAGAILLGSGIVALAISSRPK